MKTKASFRNSFKKEKEEREKRKEKREKRKEKREKREEIRDKEEKEEQGRVAFLSLFRQLAAALSPKLAATRKLPPRLFHQQI